MGAKDHGTSNDTELEKLIKKRYTERFDRWSQGSRRSRPGSICARSIVRFFPERFESKDRADSRPANFVFGQGFFLSGLIR
jgi:hypothetical protein